MAEDPAIAHLRGADPALARLIDALADVPVPQRPDRPKPGEHYAALVRTIVGQQLSTKAARAIWNRLLEHFGGRAPTPEQVLAADPEELRAAGGLSRSKTTYLRSLAEHVIEGSLELGRLEELDDDAVIAELVAVKGIGEWSAHMFLMFQLGRPDVIAPGDLGIRRGIQITYGLEEMPTPAEVVERAEAWRPYRTAACLLLWRSLDAVPAD
ncbi:MAG TPA: DNA-3-methyladenine glycosylase [Solirubrobacteraceae bacterium]|jgi:DNA-3-methyladenine glycosylase II|nr:DNA-3-methyladenine glycosylase [Solirubrobacteraceae bacterium]